MNKSHKDVLDYLIQIERRRPVPPTPIPTPLTVHHTELPVAKPDFDLAQEWNFYRREVGRLLAEGHEGRWVLIKGEQIVGIWDTLEQTSMAAAEKFQLQPALIHQVLESEKVIRGPFRQFRCPN